jgi:acetyltransferase-like isoleucine patch superfamily enzyme
MSNYARLAYAALVFAVPKRLRPLIGRRLLGWDIHPTASIGRSFIDVRHLSMGPGAGIGPRNVIRGLEDLTMAEGAAIASRNRISGWPLAWPIFARSESRRPSLVMGRHALISVGHEIDCADVVELGEHAANAGFGCQVLTHSLNLVRDQQEAAAVTIGHHAAVMSGSILMSGTSVPARSIVSAGSVVVTRLRAELTLYRGNPAEAVRELPQNLQYFLRGTAEHRGRLPHRVLRWTETPTP